MRVSEREDVVSLSEVDFGPQLPHASSFINPNKAIFLSLAVNSLFEDIPMKEFRTAKTNNNNAKYAQPEWNF